MKFDSQVYTSDPSINPSYTELNTLPYYIICRRRIHKMKMQLMRQLNREILRIAMMQSHAIASVRVDRNFSVGFPIEAADLPDFATKDDRRRINRIINMFHDKFQKKYLTILYSCGASPLEFWGTHVQNGHIRRVTDNKIDSMALEISGTNVTTTYIYSPKNRAAALGIELTFLIMIIKNMKRYFTFEITILDDKKMRRRLRMSNFQSTTKIRPFSTSIPLGLLGEWNQLQFNLAHICKKIYGSNYVETTKIQIHANCRIRRIYFADRLYRESELPDEYKITYLIQMCKRGKNKNEDKEQNSRTNSNQTSKQFEPSTLSFEGEKSTSLINSSVIFSEEQIKLQIDIPTAEYENEIDHLSIEDENLYFNEIIKE